MPISVTRSINRRKIYKLEDVLQLYADASRAIRAFIRGRVLLSDPEFIERHVPVDGTIVDLGCGHGVFSNLMALRSPERRVIGIDLDSDKIEVARTTIRERGNIDFICTDVLDAIIPECDAITIVDVLYLLTRKNQHRLLGECRRKLGKGGLLVWKAQERHPRWKFVWTYLQEYVTTSIGITRGRHGRMDFMSRQEALAAMKAAGFRPRIVEIKSWRPYTDIIYIGET